MGSRNRSPLSKDALLTRKLPRFSFVLTLESKVGTQADLREDGGTIEKLAKQKQKPITFELGEKLAKELKAVRYVECSALTQKGELVFYQRLLLKRIVQVLKTCSMKRY